MWIFLWLKGRYPLPNTEIYHTYEEAWDRFSHLQIRELPDKVVVRDEDGEFNSLTWLEFTHQHYHQ